MKLLAQIIPLLYLINASGQTNTKDIQEIEIICSFYLNGGTNHDSLMFAKAFNPMGSMMFVKNDSMQLIPLRTFMTSVRNDGKKINRKTRIDTIQVYGNAAVAKLTCEFDTFYFHDLMQLLKLKEGWKIVNKIFYREEKQKFTP